MGHRDRCEELNDGSQLVGDGKAWRSGSDRIRRRDRSGRHTRPCPHAALQEESKAASRLGGQLLAKARISQRLVVLGRGYRRRGLLGVASGTVFFPASARSIVLGWMSTESS